MFDKLLFRPRPIGSSSEKSSSARSPSAYSHDEKLSEVETDREDRTARALGGADVDNMRVDGRTLAWVQVLGSWLLFMNSWGLTSTFGVFQSYYQEHLLSTSTSSAISWIGSIQAFLTMFAGLFTGRLLDSGFLRPVMITGAFLATFGTAMTSLGTEYYQILLAQGVCVGLGSGILLLSSLAILPLYFERKRMLAAGLAATGSAIAGVFGPIMLKLLFAEIGFAWATRAYALVILVTSAAACLIMRPRKLDARPPPLFRLSFFSEPIYLLFILAFTFTMAANYIPYFYIEDYALALGVKDDVAFYLVSIMNAASAFGRITPAVLAHYYGGLNTIIGCCAFSTVVLYSFRAVDNFAGCIVIAVAYCVASGGVLFLPPIIMSNLTTKKEEFGTRIGMGYTIAAFGVLVGNPIAGATRTGDVENAPVKAYVAMKDFQGVWIVAGTAMAMATICHVVVRVLWVRRDGSAKV